MIGLPWLKRRLHVEGEAKKEEGPWEKEWGAGKETEQIYDKGLKCQTKELGLSLKWMLPSWLSLICFALK